MREICILSTRKLKIKQKQILLNADLSVIEIDFIQIELQKFQLKSTPNLLLFTSQNAVKSVLENEAISILKKIPALCVGSVTKKMLETNGFKVLETKEYASELAPIIQKKYNLNQIAFFAGNLRRNVLPIAMQQANIKYEEYLVYHNTESSCAIDSKTDAILFYSPSAVKSYLKLNTINKQTCFCIGKTTADALSDITKNIVVAKQQTIDNVIEQCINFYQ